jgi:glycosyltransferase involved in cell wall biosynthesis
MPLRVAHFVQRYPPALGGAESYFARLSRFVAAQGAQVQVYTTNALDLEAFWSPRGSTLPPGIHREANVEVRRYPVRHFPLHRYALKGLSLLPWPRWQAFTLPCNPITPQMWSDCGRKTQIDLVHATAFPYAWPILCGLRLARRLRVPFFLTPFLHLGNVKDAANRMRRSYLAPALQELLHTADRIFVQTNLERQAVLELGIASERVCLQGLGVAAAECTGGSRQEAQERWHLPAKELCIGHLANLSWEKGTVDLVTAAQRLWQRGLKFRLLLAGPMMPNFHRFWQRQPPGLPVSLLGAIADEEKKDFYAACDLFALPSRSDSFGLVLLEAWANGMPCVGYRAGGIAEVIRHGQDGLLADCDDIAGLAETLAQLLEDSSLRQQFGAAGQQRIQTEHRWEQKLTIVTEAYRGFLPSGQRKASG